MPRSLITAYEYLISFGKLLRSPILLLCRLYWGWLFMESGLGKLKNIGQTTEFFQRLHIYIPHFMAYLAALTEFLGGLCLMIGFASRLITIPLIIVMITAYSTAHIEALRAIFTKPSLFIAESAFNFLLTALLVLAFGPGKFSVDYLLEKWVFKKLENHR